MPIRRVRRGLSSFARTHRPVWRWGLNLGATRAWRRQRPELGGAEARIGAELAARGIALASVEELLGDDVLFADLRAAVARDSAARAASLAQARCDADEASAIGQKTFLVELLGPRPELNPGDAYGRFALAPAFLRIANAYFGMYTRLRYYNVWHTVPARVAPRESQLWHRDREDLQILKIFVYLEDVPSGAGPLTYVPGTHARGRLRSAEPPSFLEGGVKRSTDEQMATVAAPSDWILATGSRGRIVFADTHGYHKGGLARDRDRVLFVSMFTSPASDSPELADRRAADGTASDPARRWALGGPVRIGLGAAR